MHFVNKNTDSTSQASHNSVSAHHGNSKGKANIRVIIMRLPSIYVIITQWGIIMCYESHKFSITEIKSTFPSYFNEGVRLILRHLRKRKCDKQPISRPNNSEARLATTITYLLKSLINRLLAGVDILVLCFTWY